MADPTKLDFADWFAIVATGLGSGIVGAMGWFSTSKRRMHERITGVEESMQAWHDKHATHSTEIAVMKTCQENTAERLETINQTTRDTNESLKELSQTVTQVLLALQSKK